MQQTRPWQSWPLHNKVFATFERVTCMASEAIKRSKKSACVKLTGALTKIIFCCCSEVLMFHEESNFKKDESIIPNNTGIISLNDLHLVMRPFQPYYPKSGLNTAIAGA